MSDHAAEPGEAVSPRKISRRTFLIGAGAATAAGLVLERQPLWRLVNVGPPPPPPPNGWTGPVNVGTKTSLPTIKFRRADDLLSLEFEFYNLKLDTTDPANPVLVPIPPAGEFAAIVAVFPPQALAEQAFFEEQSSPADPNPDPATSETLPELPVQSRLAGETRLAFLVKNGVTSIPYTSASLLSWMNWGQPNIVGSAVSDATSYGSYPTFRAPQEWETAIELPWRLVISPNETSGWSHSLAPVTHGTPYTELWHSRLGVLNQSTSAVDFDPSDPTLSFRGIYALDPDFASGTAPSESSTGPFPSGDDPFRSPLAAFDRYAIVEASGDYSNASNGVGNRPYVPTPISDVNLLMLTPLGGYLDSIGRWPAAPPNPAGLALWQHKATLGRDHYVKVVYYGYLFPFQFRAALVKETERKFQFNQSGDVLGAFLRQRYYIYLRESTRNYGDSNYGAANNQRLWPLRTLECTTLVTPDIDPPKHFVNNQTQDQEAFAVTINGGMPLQFHFHSLDWNGDKSSFTAPCLFIAQDVAQNPGPNTTMQYVAQTYNGVPDTNGDTPLGPDDPLRQVQFNRQRVSLARPRPGKSGETASPITSFTWGVEPGNGTDTDFSDNDQPAFYPIVASAQIANQVAQQANGGNPIDDSSVTFYVGKPSVGALFGNFTGDGGFLQSDAADGFGSNNPGEVFLSLDHKQLMQFAGADKSGGMMTPNLNMSGVSRALGITAGDLDSLAGGKFDPQSVFGDALAQAKLLGAIALKDIIGLVGDLLGADGNAVDQALKILQQQVPQLDGHGLPVPSLPPAAIDISIDWKPDLQADPLNIFRPHSDASAELMAKLHTDLLNPSSSSSSVQGSITNFDVVLFGDAFAIIQITFNKLGFTASNGQKPNFNVDIGQVQFLGVLEFVQQLEDLLHSNGYGIEVTPTEISASLSLQIPDIGVGVFSLSNMAFSAELDIPFNNDPVRARFAFCSRDNPFLLTVYIFGGGGFFSIQLGLDGLEMMEAQLEFGAAASIDLGVASGGIHIMAGIYFKMQLASEITPAISPAPPAGTFDIMLTGFLDMGGSVEAFGILTVSIDCYLSFTYDSIENKVTGQATLTISVSVFCFSASASFSIERHFGGTGSDPTFLNEYPTQSLWNNYAAAFAPIGS